MKFTKIIATMAVGAMLLTSCGSATAVISAGDVKVTDKDIKFLADYFYEQNVNAGQNANYDSLKDQLVEMLEEAALNKAVAGAMEVELDDESKKAIIGEMANLRSGFGGKAEFEKAIKKAGASEDAMELFSGASHWIALLSENEDLKVEDPSDDEVKKYFKENYLRAKHVLISVGEDVATGDLEKTQAEDILKKAQEGANFDELVKEHSQDPGSATNPDGYVFTDGQMVPEFENGTKSIKPGEFTLVKSDFGYHVIQRLALDESDAKFAEMFEANKDAAKTACKQAKFDEKLKKYAADNGVEVVVDEAAVENLQAPEVDADAAQTEE